MRAALGVARQLAGNVTGAALRECAGVPLQLIGCHIVVGVRIAIWPLRVGSAMATLTHHAAVPRTHPVQLRVAGAGIREAVEARRYRRLGESLVGWHDRGCCLQYLAKG